MTSLELDRVNTITEMRRRADFLRSLPAERPGRGRLEGQVLRRPDGWIADLDTAIVALAANEWPAPASPLESVLLRWIAENEEACRLPGQDASGRGLHQRIIARATRLLERVE